MRDQVPTALVTGASSGIGKAVCERLSDIGCTVYAVARRRHKLEALAQEYPSVIPVQADISDERAVEQLAKSIGDIDAIVHAAGGARGRSAVVDSDTDEWSWMWQTNVLGSMYILRAFVPQLINKRSGDIIVVTSVAAFECLERSSGYSTTKHAQSAMVRTLRNELLGTGVGVTEICPGLVQTEFFEQRFPGAPERAQEIFNGLDPLQADDIADIVAFVLRQPKHVNIDQITVRPMSQGSHGRFHRVV